MMRRALCILLLLVCAPAVALAADSDTPAKPKKALPRTLEDINIEGDIPVPQVPISSEPSKMSSFAFSRRPKAT